MKPDDTNPSPARSSDAFCLTVRISGMTAILIRKILFKFSFKMDSQPDKIISQEAKKFRRTEEEKFSNHFLEQVFQSIIPVNKLLK